MWVSMRCGVRPVLSRRASGCATLQMRQSVSPIVREREVCLRAVPFVRLAKVILGRVRRERTCRVVKCCPTFQCGKKYGDSNTNRIVTAIAPESGKSGP